MISVFLLLSMTDILHSWEAVFHLCRLSSGILGAIEYSSNVLKPLLSASYEGTFPLYSYQFFIAPIASILNLCSGLTSVLACGLPRSPLL